MTYERAATAWASNSWKPHGCPCGPAPPRAPQPDGDSLGTTPETYSSRGTTLTVRGDPSELYTAWIDPRRVMLDPIWHNWSAWLGVPGSPMPGALAGTAVGPTAPVPTKGPHGPAHPGPTWMFQPPAPLGLINTAETLVAPVTPVTDSGDPEVTMTVLPLFSVRATRTEVDS